MSQPIGADVIRMSAASVDFTLNVPDVQAELFPVRFTAREALHEPFEVVIEAIAPRASGRAPAPHQLLGQAATFVLWHDTGARRFQGVLAEASIAGERRGWRVYRLRLVPELWILGQGLRSRVFQAMTSAEIFVHLLKEAGYDDERIHVSLETERTPRDQAIQHRESSLAFAQRLLAEDGITFFHAWRRDDRVVPDEDAGDKLSIVITDQQITFEQTPELPSIAYRPPSFAGGAGTYVRSLAWHRHARPSAVIATKYDFRQPSSGTSTTAFPTLVGEAALDGVPFEDQLGDWTPHVGWATRHVQGNSSDSPFDRARLGVEADKPKDAYDDDQLGAAGVNRAMALHAAAITVEGTSDCRHLRHGAWIEVTDHPDSDLDGKYLVTWVEHEGRQSPPDDPGFAAGDAPPYANRFGGCPHDLPWRPAFRPAPRMESIHLGVVVGPEGEEIHCDPLGRIKVRFHWDVDPAAADAASAWVRVMQPWAGNGWGHVTIPRVGQEVVVGYVDGNPNEPVVLGTLYNGDNQPPYTLPEHKTRFAIKSRSTPSGTDSNEIRFEDKKGEEDFYLHASNSMTTAVDGDASRTVGHDDTLTVDNLRKVKAKNIDVEATEDHKTVVRRTYTVTAEKDGKFTTPEFSVTSKTGKGSISLESSTILTLKVGASEIKLEPGKITISSPVVEVTGTSSAKVTSPDFHAGEGGNGYFAKGGTVETKGTDTTVSGSTNMKTTGGTVSSEATGSNRVSGPTVEVNGTTTAQIKGGMVKLN